MIPLSLQKKKDLCDVLLPGCPVLEELSVLNEGYKKVRYSISSRSIKKLSFCYKYKLVVSEVDFMKSMSFDAPNLVSLDYELAMYPQVNLESLVEARLGIHYSKLVKRPDLTGLVIGMRNLETLHLSPASADVSLLFLLEKTH